MLSTSRQISPSGTTDSRRWPTALLFATGLIGMSMLATIVIAGPTRLTEIRLAWVATYLLLLGGCSLWWAVFLWLMSRLGGLSLPDGLNRSIPLMALTTLSLIPVAVVFLAGRLPFPVVFDGNLRSLYIWIAGLAAFLVFVGQELTLAAAVQKRGTGELLGAAARRLACLPRQIVRLPGRAFRLCLRHPILAVLLTAVLVAGLIQRWQIVKEFHAGDMNDLLSVAFTILGWPPFRYYHDYRPQTYIFAHLPLFPIMVAPFYWLFENVTKLPTPWAVKLVSALADVALALLVFSQTRERWRGIWGLVVAALVMLSPLVITSNDRPVSAAAAFTVAALVCHRRDWLCGILIALGVATRTEAAFLALPLIIHFLVQRELQEKVVFLGAFATTLGIVALPFVLTDPEAIDFAMRLQGQRQASGHQAVLLMLLQPHLPEALGSWLQRNPSYFPAAMVVAASLLAARDGRVMRVALLVATVHILSIPVLHPHYMVFCYAAGVLYSASYGNPLVAIATLAATGGLAPISGHHGQLALAGGLALLSLLRPEHRDRSGNHHHSIEPSG